MPDAHPADQGAAYCPGCGAPNGCAIAADQPASTCWCMRMPHSLSPTVLPPEVAKPTATSCWCPRCLREHRQPES